MVPSTSDEPTFSVLSRVVPSGLEITIYSLRAITRGGGGIEVRQGDLQTTIQPFAQLATAPVIEAWVAPSSEWSEYRPEQGRTSGDRFEIVFVTLDQERRNELLSEGLCIAKFRRKAQWSALDQFQPMVVHMSATPEVRNAVRQLAGVAEGFVSRCLGRARRAPQEPEPAPVPPPREPEPVAPRQRIVLRPPGSSSKGPSRSYEPPPVQPQPQAAPPPQPQRPRASASPTRGERELEAARAAHAFIARTAAIDLTPSAFFAELDALIGAATILLGSSPPTSIASTIADAVDLTELLAEGHASLENALGALEDRLSRS